MTLILLVGYAIVVDAVVLWLTKIGLEFNVPLQSFSLPSDIPFVSTIVPARNEERNIDRVASGREIKWKGRR